MQLQSGPKAESLTAALRCFAAGDMFGAERICREILALAPQSPQALHLLGCIAARHGKTAEAIELVRRAVTIDARAAPFHTTLAELSWMSGDARGAEAAFAKALALAPRSADAHLRHGRFLLASGAVMAATAALKRAVALDPKSAEVHLAYARALRAANRDQDALNAAHQAVYAKRDFAEALLLIAQLRRGMRDIDLALTYVQEALIADEKYAPAYVEIGSICLDLNRADDAAGYFREALWLDPSAAEAHVGLGYALRLKGRAKEATDSLNCALEINPASAAAHIGLGLIASALGDLDQALLHFDRAIETSPNSPARYNRALALLRHGRLADGWKAYESRWTSPVFKAAPRHQKIRRWRGEDLAGKKLLVWGEQGVGDEIIFSTMIPDLIARGADLTLECDARLVPLFQRTWPQVKVAAEPRPPEPPTLYKGFQRQAAAGGLGEHLRPDLSAFPKRKNLLEPDRRHAEVLRKELKGSAPGALLVGISWMSKTPVAAAQKSTALTDWAPILKQGGARFINLQYGDTYAERAEAERSLDVQLTHSPEIDLTEDLDGVAALCAACDLVISVSNTTVHLAGAVGTPVWALLPPAYAQPWYWFTDGENSPWYESVRLFRPAAGETWADVIKRAAAELRRHLKA